jgi:intracellular sulfur oxidation DsrE/DsrF family protein
MKEMNVRILINHLPQALAFTVALLAVAPLAASEHKPSIAQTSSQTDTKPQHRLVLQVNSNDPALMNLALNNASNVIEYYKSRDEAVSIEIIAFGPGLHMLRADTSPVRDRIETIGLGMPQVSFAACGNTRENMSKAEKKEIPLLPEAQVVPSGVVRAMELQEQGWTYIKP